MSRGEEWANELSALAAEHHGRPIPTEGRVVLTAEERSAGLRADASTTQRRVLARLIGPKIRAAIQEVGESFDRLKRTLEATGQDFDALVAKVQELSRDADSADGGRDA